MRNQRIDEVLERMHSEVLERNRDIPKSVEACKLHGLEVTKFNGMLATSDRNMNPAVATAASISWMIAAASYANIQAGGKDMVYKYLQGIMEMISIRLAEEGVDICIDLTMKDFQGKEEVCARCRVPANPKKLGTLLMQHSDGELYCEVCYNALGGP